MARDFTPAEDRAILLAREEFEVPWKHIAAVHGRSLKGVQTRYQLIKDTLSEADYLELRTEGPEKSPRFCLRCEGSFLSTGPENRICEPCTLANSRVWTFGRTLHTVSTVARTGIDAPIPCHHARMAA